MQNFSHQLLERWFEGSCLWRSNDLLVFPTAGVFQLQSPPGGRIENPHHSSRRGQRVRRSRGTTWRKWRFFTWVKQAGSHSSRNCFCIMRSWPPGRLYEWSKNDESENLKLKLYCMLETSRGKKWAKAGQILPPNVFKSHRSRFQLQSIDKLLLKHLDNTYVNVSQNWEGPRVSSWEAIQLHHFSPKPNLAR